MARSARVVQTPNDGPSNVYRPVSASPPPNAPLVKSLGPHTHCPGSSEHKLDDAQEQFEHQDRGDSLSHAIEFSSTTSNQVDAEYPSLASTQHNPCVSLPPANPSHDVNHLITAEGLSIIGLANQAQHDELPNLNSDTHASTDGLDPFILYGIGQFLCSIARNKIAQNLRSAQSHLLDWFPVPSNVPAPTSANLDHHVPGHPPPAQHLSRPIIQLDPPPHPHVAIPTVANSNEPAPLPVPVSVNQLHPDPDSLLNPTFGFDMTHTEPPDAHPPPDVNPSWHDPNPLFANGPVPSSSQGTENPDQPSATTNPGLVIVDPGPNPDPRFCSRCNKRFNRLSDLLDHMHKHGAEKRHACKFCGVRIAYRNNLVEHQRRCEQGLES